MLRRTPIKKPFADIRRNGGHAKGFFKEKSKDTEIIPDTRPMSIMADWAEIVAGASASQAAALIFPLDHGAGCRYSCTTKIEKVESRHLKPAFSIPHIQKFFCVKCPVPVRAGRLFRALVTLGAFLFLGGHTMQDKFEVPSYPPPHTVPNPPPPRAESGQEAKQAARPEERFRAFCSLYKHPVDILENAAGVIQFLEDVCPGMIDIGGNLGLSEKGMTGLWLIYQTLGETIRAAIDACNERDKAMGAATGKQEVTA